jgi:hypothetical protein
LVEAETQWFNLEVVPIDVGLRQAARVGSPQWVDEVASVSMTSTWRSIESVALLIALTAPSMFASMSRALVQWLDDPDNPAHDVRTGGIIHADRRLPPRDGPVRPAKPAPQTGLGLLASSGSGDGDPRSSVKMSLRGERGPDKDTEPAR